MSNRPTPGEVESRTGDLEVAERRIRGLIPYGVESRDLGGWREVIAAGALRDAKLDELRVVIDHQGVPLGRFPRTLAVEERSDGLHWSLNPPKSRQDVVEAIERGDVVAGSWRMRVGRDRWEGDTRHVEAIDELLDVTIVGSEQPAYPQAAIEYRTVENDGGERRQEGGNMPTEDGAAVEHHTEHGSAEEHTEESIENKGAEERTTPPAGSLRVEERSSVPRRGLADEFRAAGFPGEVAEIPWSAYEKRAVTWTPSIDLLNQTDRQGVPLGFDARYVWTVLPRVGVDASVTSVQVLQQSARSLATAANVVRSIDATSNKPESGSTVNLITVPLKQVATVQSGIPNVVLEQAAINTVIENDLRLAVNEGMDKIVNDTLAASGFQAPGTDNLVASVRKAMTTLLGAGYAPDTLVLTPAASETLDLLVSGISGGTADYVFQPGQPAPGIWGLRRVISKVIAAPVVLDSNAYGRLYASPARLARFEENDGKTNTSLVRLELHAAAGVERQSAAVRIATS
jgi:phage head maturation protease